MIFTFFYLLGIASCGIQGAGKAPYKPLATQALILPFFSGFGGGLIRDLVLLCVFPAVFSEGSLGDLVTVFFAGFLLLHVHPKSVKEFAAKTDIVSVGTFIAIGAEKAIAQNTSPLMAILSAAVTSLGGGAIASYISGVEIKNILSENLRYRIVVIFCAIIYVMMRVNGATQFAVQNLSIPCTALAISLSSKMHWNSFYYLSNNASSHSYGIYLKILIFMASHMSYVLHAADCNIIMFSMNRSQRLFCVFHRILQM